jgi:hypothetical protein
VNAPLQIRPRPPYQRSKPVRDRVYKQFIKSHPCEGCGQTWWVDPCHTGPHAYGVQADDSKCIPLCRPCHEAFDANPRQFAEENHIDVAALIRRFNEFYDRVKGRAA